MACARCPYTQSYTLLWEHRGTQAVLLRCCAGPELQVRDGHTVVVSEIYTTVTDVQRRAEQLRLDRLAHVCDTTNHDEPRS